MILGKSDPDIDLVLGLEIVYGEDFLNLVPDLNLRAFRLELGSGVEVDGSSELCPVPDIIVWSRASNGIDPSIN